MGYWGFSTTRAASHRWAGSGPISRRADQAPPTPRSADSSCAALSSGNRPHVPPKVSLSPWQQSAVRQAKDAPPRVHHQTLCWPGLLPGIQVLVVWLLVLFWGQSRNCDATRSLWDLFSCPDFVWTPTKSISAGYSTYADIIWLMLSSNTLCNIER